MQTANSVPNNPTDDAIRYWIDCPWGDLGVVGTTNRRIESGVMGSTRSRVMPVLADEGQALGVDLFGASEEIAPDACSSG